MGIMNQESQNLMGDDHIVSKTSLSFLRDRIHKILEECTKENPDAILISFHAGRISEALYGQSELPVNLVRMQN